MKKKPERKHVTITSEHRSDTGKDRHIVTWTPKPNDRRRLSFTGLGEAEAEADRIEALMEGNFLALASVPRARLSTLNYFCEQLPDDGGATMLRIFQTYFEKHMPSQAKAQALVKEVGELFKHSRSNPDYFSSRQIGDVRKHVNRFCRLHGERAFTSINNTEIQQYLDNTIGGAPKTRKQHLITLRAWWAWARDVGANGKRFLPAGESTAPEVVPFPKTPKSEHELYSPEEFTRLLAATPSDMVMFMVLGQLGGFRAEERLQLFWHHWRTDEDNKIVANEDVTKTEKRRRVDVCPVLAEWMLLFRGDKDALMCIRRTPHKVTSKIAKAAGVAWLDNALRAGFASYHYELHDNPALTSKNSGHSVNELETTYKSISGVTKAKAEAIFSITPQVVIDYCKSKNLPEPEWAGLLLQNQEAEAA